jgi:hypothetical protein
MVRVQSTPHRGCDDRGMVGDSTYLHKCCQWPTYRQQEEHIRGFRTQHTNVNLTHGSLAGWQRLYKAFATSAAHAADRHAAELPAAGNDCKEPMHQLLHMRALADMQLPAAGGGCTRPAQAMLHMSR